MFMILLIVIKCDVFISFRTLYCFRFYVCRLCVILPAKWLSNFLQGIDKIVLYFNLLCFPASVNIYLATLLSTVGAEAKRVTPWVFVFFVLFVLYCLFVCCCCCCCCCWRHCNRTSWRNAASSLFIYLCTSLFILLSRLNEGLLIQWLMTFLWYAPVCLCVCLCMCVCVCVLYKISYLYDKLNHVAKNMFYNK